MWTEFLSGYIAGIFTMLALCVWAACAVGGRYDDAMTEPYDPEVR